MIRICSCLNRWLTSLVLLSLLLGPLSAPVQVSASQRMAASAVKTPALSLSDLTITLSDYRYILPGRIYTPPVTQPDAGMAVSVVIEPAHLPADGKA